MKTSDPLPFIALLAAITLTSCGTSGTARNAANETSSENDFLKDKSTPNAVAEKMFGLDYSTDADTGQTLSDRSFDVRNRNFSKNNKTFSKQASDRSKKFDTDAFAGGRSAETKKHFGSKKFATSDSRMGNKQSRFANRQVRGSDSAYRDASKSVPSDPYRESSKLMRAGEYRRSAAAQEKNNRANKYPQRPSASGDAPVNYRTEELTVDDVKGLLNKGAGKATLSE